MIWEGEPDASTAERLAKSGLKCIVFDSCANVPVVGDYLTTQRRNLVALVELHSESL